MRFFKQILILLVIVCMLVSCEITPLFTSSTASTTTPPSASSTTTGSDVGSVLPDDTEIIVPGEEEEPESDPYINVDADEFYENYKPATSNKDAYYRTQHNLMSGSIAEQDQKPTVASDRPMQDGKYIRNTSAIYSEDGDTYYVINAHGQIVNRIFKDGAYVTLEEVAAYLLAFGDIPANYSKAQILNVTFNKWGIYARGNHSEFIGDTKKYRYEPELPNISGCGGTFQYYEIDIGTTGTDCSPSYPAKPYNDGNKITRGAARIVYSRYDKNGNGQIDIDEKYVFYTYNHYNDFQEYLNYEGGWGEMFGNITGGGKLSSNSRYNPTPYVEVIKKNLYIEKENNSVSIEYIELAFIYLEKKYSSIYNL